MINSPGKDREGEPMVPGRDEVVVRLPDEGGKVANVKDVRSAFLKAINDKENQKVQELLSANNGINLEASDKDGHTPIVFAAKQGQWEVVKDLAARNVNLEAKDASDDYADAGDDEDDDDDDDYDDDD